MKKILIKNNTVTNANTTYLVNPAYSTGLHFVHRQEDLRNLKTLLDQKGAAIVVQGIGGIGKSALMQRFVQVYGAFYDNVLFLEFDSKFGEADDDRQYNRESFARAFFRNNELPKKLGYKYDESRPYTDLLTPLLNLLRGLPGNNLMVLDNVADAIEEWINDLPHSDNWHVLLSSRESIAEFTPYGLNPLSSDNLVDLFNTYYTVALKNAGFNAEEAAEKRDNVVLAIILKNIGYHTLTTELLAKTAGEQAWSVADLAAHVREGELTFKQRVKSTYKGETRFGTLWEHLMSRFVVSLPDDAQTILRYFSVLPSEALSFDVLCILFQKEGEAADQLRGILDLLVRKGWLNRSRGNWECHAIIQKVLRDRLKPDDDNCEDLINGAANLFYIDESKGEHGIYKKDFLNIGKSIHLYLDCEKESFSRFCNEINLVYWHLGNYDKALYYGLKSNEIYEKVLGKDHLTLATSYNNVALIYQDQGNYDKALEFNEKALAIKEKVFDKDHPSLATSYNNVALIYQDQGNYDKALEFALKDIAISEKVLDKDHPVLATSYNNVALIYKNQGNYAKALEFNEKAMAIREKKLDKDHPLLATSYNNVATIYKDQGNYDKALEFNEKAIAIREKVLDKDHPLLATSYNNVATIYKNQGNYDKALEFNLKSIIIREKVLDKDHPDLGTSYMNIATIYLDLKDFDKAKYFIDKAVVIYQKALPPEHPYQAMVLSWQKEIYEAVGTERNKV